jgi:3-oxoacyl-[acyl-carrier-protein] synthase II
MYMNRRAVITGFGVLAANGIGEDAFWSSLLEGKSGICRVTQFDPQGLTCQIAGEVKGFQPEKYIYRQLKPRRMGRFSQFAIASTLMAIEKSRLDLQQLQQEYILPIVMGISTSAMDLFAKKPQFFTGPGSIPNAAASATSVELGLNTRLTTLSSACVSSTDAMAIGTSMIRLGESDIVLVGGSDSSITRYVFEGIGQSGMLSSRNDHPEHASRPFDQRRDGGIIAEAAGMIVMESLEHALARGATIYAEITGYGSISDAATAQDGSGLEASMQKAIANAGLRAKDIDTISAHGPSDIHLDKIETSMIKQVFGNRAYDIPVTSIKGTTGNPFGAAGVLQIITSILSMQHGLIPPIANYEHPDPACSLDFVATAPRAGKFRRILINSHGVGRVNSSLVIEKVSSA